MADSRFNKKFIRDEVSSASDDSKDEDEIQNDVDAQSDEEIDIGEGGSLEGSEEESQEGSEGEQDEVLQQ